MTVFNIAVENFGAKSKKSDKTTRHPPKTAHAGKIEYAVEAWAFINHISLMLIYSVYNHLREANALKKYSVSDFIQFLKYIRMVKINNAWFVSEVTAKTKAL